MTYSISGRATSAPLSHASSRGTALRRSIANPRGPTHFSFSEGTRHHIVPQTIQAALTANL